MKVTGSKKNLLDEEELACDLDTAESENVDELIERPLGPVEKKFLLHAERGDCATVKR